MTKTRLDCITQSLRQAGISDIGDAASAEDAAIAGELLDGAYAEMSNAMTISWALSAIPDNVFIPLCDLLEADIRAAYERPQRMGRGRALVRVRKEILTDDRKVIEDLDDSGTITDAEEGVRDRMLFY